MPAESADFALATWWHAWPRAVRTLLVVAALGFAAALGGLLVAALWADDATLPWRTVTTLADVPVTLDTVRVGTLALPIQGSGQLLTQTLVPAGPLLPSAGATGWALAGLALVLVGYLTVLPGLGWRTFLVGAGGLIFFLSTLNLDLLGLLPARFGGPLQQVALVGSLVLLGGTAYALHAFLPKIGPSARLLLFTGLVGALGALVLGGAPQPAAVTALHLVAYATSGLLVVAGLFIAFISFENLRALLWLTGQAQNPAHRRGLGPFMVTTLLYLANLLLLYLHVSGWLLLGGALVDAVLVLLCSIGSGLVGLRIREAEYGRVVPYLLMAPLYLLVAACTLGLLAWGFYTANDPLLEAFAEWTVVTHLAAGVGFTIYVLANFVPLIQRRLRTYRVVFEPRRVPLITVYLILAMGVGFTMARDLGFVVKLARAAYFNGLGDLARAAHDEVVADRYYAGADWQIKFNRKANLSRAALARAAGENQREENMLRRALERNLSEKTVAQLAALFTGPTDFFSRQAVLRRGLRAYPASPTLNLLMGELYAHTTITDSATFYFARAERSAPARVLSALQVDRLAWELRSGRLTEAARRARAVRPSDAPAAQANALLTGLLTGQRIALPGPLPTFTDSLTAEEFGLLIARTLRTAADHSPDTAAAPLLAHWAGHTANLVYGADLLEARALLLGGTGAAQRARAAMLERAEAGEGEAAGRRYAVLGQWALRDNQPRQAAVWLTKAADRGHQPAFYERVLALALAGQLDSARGALPILYTASDPDLLRRTGYLDSVLNAPPEVLTAAPARADAVVLRSPGLPDAAADELLAGIRQAAGRTVAIGALAERALTHDQPARAAQLLALAPAKAPALRWLQIETAIRTRELATARALLPAQPPTELRAAARYQYLTGALALAEKRLPAARKALLPLPAQAPWLSRGVLATADLLTRYPQPKTPMAAYDALSAGVRYNPESAALWQAYALECARQGLGSFGHDALDQLAPLLSAEALATFRTVYTTRLAARHAADGFE